LVHELSINQNLMSTNSIVHCIGRIRTCRDLNLTPFSVGRNELALLRSLLELGVHPLIFDTTLALNKGRFCHIVSNMKSDGQ